MSISFNNATHRSTSRLNYTITIPSHLTLSTQTLVIKDDLRSCANAGETNCIDKALHNLRSSFASLIEWLSRLFSKDLPSDPILLAKWDPVIEKEYDPLGATRPHYIEAYNQGVRGHTIADSLARAASKTGLNPLFQKILIYRKSGAGLLFTSDGAYSNLYHRARNGEFNNPNTLIIIAFQEDLSERAKQRWIQDRIYGTEQAGLPIQNAHLHILNGKETADLNSDRMPVSLLKLFKRPS